MENILIDFFKTRLTTVEKQQLDTTGFFVRDTGFSYLILNLLFIIFWIPGDLFIFSLMTQFPITIISIVLGMAFIYVSWYAWLYAKFSIIFYHSRGIISGGKFYLTQKELINELIVLSDPLKIFLEEKMSKLYSLIIKIKLLRQKLWMFYLFLWFGVFMVGSQEKDMLIATFKIFGIYTLMIIFVISIAYIAHYNSIYYKFGNLGKKIQSLTPRIEEQSQKIQSEFESDMNFSVLSNGFDSLSSIFSSIVALVIKLEKVEARVSKGNLFDSEKYINSLRSDIITPLTSLKVFLEKQKTELLESQKEFTRVRVGGDSPTGNVELQSKRSKSLIQELTENIEKLDAMIRKIGE